MTRDIYFCIIQQVHRNLFHKQEGKEERNRWRISKRSSCRSKRMTSKELQVSADPTFPHCQRRTSRSKNTYIGRSAERFPRVCSSLVAQEDLENTASTCLPHHKQTAPHSWHNLWRFHSSGAEPESGIWHLIFWRVQPIVKKKKTLSVFSLQN